MNSSKIYKSVEAENKAYKHYARNVRKLRRELEEMNETTYKAIKGMSLYELINDLWNFWGKGFIIPLISYGVEIEKVDSYYLVSLDWQKQKSLIYLIYKEKGERQNVKS